MLEGGVAAAIAVLALGVGVPMFRAAEPGTPGRRWGGTLAVMAGAVILLLAVLWAAWIVFDLAG